jgi:hypothetical protein
MHLVDHEQTTLTEDEFELFIRLRRHLALSAADVGPAISVWSPMARRTRDEPLVTVMTREDLVAFDELEAAIAKAVEEKLEQCFTKSPVGRVAREFTHLRPMETVEGQEETARRAVARCFEEVAALAPSRRDQTRAFRGGAARPPFGDGWRDGRDNG